MNRYLIFILIIIVFQLQANEITNDIYLNSDDVFYNKEENLIYLGKNSLINYQKSSIRTDGGKIDINSKKIFINGIFYLNYSKDIMKGNQLKADLNFKEGSAKNVNYIFDKELKINSEILTKNKKEIIFENNFLTRCKLEGFFNCPTWSLKIKKTRYNIKSDYFEHYGTFLQIADKKVFYLPYFSHYGSKALRQKGFLTPSLEFVNSNYGGNITTPYYIPLNTQTDIKITPTFYYEKGFTNYFKNKIDIQSKISEGDVKIFLNNFYDKSIEDYVKKGYTVATNANLNINQENTLNVNLNYTTNTSQYKSTNNSKASTLVSNITLNTYNILKSNDLMMTRISGTKALSDTMNSINPYELPTISYFNYLNFKNNIILNNNIKIELINRNKSADYLPMKIFRTNLKNDLQKNYYLQKNTNLINKLKIVNSSIVVKEENKNINVKSDDYLETAIYASSEINKIFRYRNKTKIKPRAKIILANTSKSANININDNSQSLSFNYNNLFQENKYFGSDKKEKGSRLVIALEQEHNINHKINFEVNYGRIFNFEENKNLMNDIKQKGKLSDHLMELNFKFGKNSIKYNSRLDKKNLNLKEDTFSYEAFNEKNRLIINKNLTNKESYINSNSNHFVTMEYNRTINKNSSLSYKNEIDLQGKYQSYSEEFMLSFSDECQKINLSYLINNYNDGERMKPNKRISLKYEMDF
jgi:LPS-assembly protein